MKKAFILVITLLIFVFVRAQIGGLSASKLNTLSATVVDTCKLEFEPSLSIEQDIHVVHTNVFTHDTTIGRTFNFRFTYGAARNLEIGFSTPVDLGDVSLGMKYNFLSGKKVLMSLIAGVNLAIDKQLAVNDFGAGLVTTLQYTQSASSDFELVYMHNQMEPAMSGVFFNMDHGLYIGKFQYIIGLNSMIIPSHMEASQVWLTPGVTIEPARQFLMVITYNYSFLETDFRSQGISFALTITLD